MARSIGVLGRRRALARKADPAHPLGTCAAKAAARLTACPSNITTSHRPTLKKVILAEPAKLAHVQVLMVLCFFGSSLRMRASGCSLPFQT
jgi:hypothetical protein